jgi:hypothetical protein
MENGEPRSTRFRALLIGNAIFDAGDPDLGNLKGPLNDVDALAERLAHKQTGLFQCEPLLKNATAKVMRDEVGKFFEAGTEDDCLLFYYSGHGRLDITGRFYLCGSDTDTRMHLYTPRLAGELLSEMVSYSPARLKIIILDCCYASEFKGGDWLRKYMFGQGCFVLTARHPDGPLVPDAKTPRDLSPFTALLVEALGSGELDGDRDGFVTVNEVAQYISTRSHTTFAFQHWTGTGIVPIARTASAQPGVQAVIVVPDTIDHPSSGAGVVPFSVPDRSGLLPDLLPVPGTSARLGRYLVTNSQFRAFLRAVENAAWRPETARRAPLQVDHNYLRDWDDADFPDGFEHYPVVNVSSSAAAAYTAWAGRQLGEALRLPSPAEWEAAAIAGRLDTGWLAADVAAGRVNFRSTLGAPAAVADFEPNPYGFCDLIGNVWDLCVDGSGSPTLRGGAFNTPQARLTEHLPLSSSRQCREDVGFRCAVGPGRRTRKDA